MKKKAARICKVLLCVALLLSPAQFLAGSAPKASAGSKEKNHPVIQSIDLIKQGEIEKARSKLEAFREEYCGQDNEKIYEHYFLDRQLTNLYLALCYALLDYPIERDRALQNAFSIIGIAWHSSWDYHTNAFIQDTTTLSKSWSKEQQGNYHYMLYVLYSIWGESDKALSEAVTAATLDPTNGDRAQEVAYVFFMAQKFDESVRWYQTAAQLKPTNAKVFSNLGALENVIGDSSGAILHLEKAFVLDKNDASIRVNLILAYSAAGQYEKAEKIYRESIPKFPKSAQLLKAVSLYYLVGSKRYAEADKKARELGADYLSKQPTVLALHAASMVGLNKGAQAQSMMQEVINREPRAKNKEFLSHNWCFRGHTLELILPLLSTIDKAGDVK